MRLKVKPHNPWKTRLFLLLGAAGLLIGGWSLYDYGRYMAGYDSAEAGRELVQLMATVDALNAEIESLREQKAQLERAAQIERKAYQEQDASLKALQAEILELKEELAFYRGIVSPREASRGLRLQSFTLEPNGPRSWRYKVVLTQVLKNDRLARGTVRLKVDGLQGGNPRSLELAALTEKPVKELAYRFKYFQNLEGDLILPKGFVPLRVTVRILPRGRRSDAIEKTIDWPKQEKPDNVG